MPRLNWSAVLQAAVLIRLGQELGSDTPAARAVHDLLGIVLAIFN